MTDFICFAPDFPTLTTVAKNLPKFWVPDAVAQDGSTIPGHMPDQWATGNGAVVWHYWGTWYAPDGTTVTDSFGNQVPHMVAKPGVYGILRVNDDLLALKLPKSVVVTTTPAQTDAQGNQISPATTVIHGPLGVTFTSPLPVDAPVRF